MLLTGRKHLKALYSKLVSADEALKLVKSGDLVLSGGFGICGNPNYLLKRLSERSDLKDLTIVSNNTGLDEHGIGHLIRKGMVKRCISSYLGNNKTFYKMYMNGEIELEITPQGTIAEKVRSGGKGIPAFWTPTGVGTLVEHGGFPVKYAAGGKSVELVSQAKPAAMIKGKKYLMEETIFGDVAIVRAHKADKKGNLIYRLAARNFNQDMATAANLVIAEVDEVVEIGELDPDHVHTPGIFVDYIVRTGDPNKPIEFLVLNDGAELKFEGSSARAIIAKRAAQEVQSGMTINMGIGIPTLIPHFIPKDREVEIHSENGVLGVCGNPKPGEQDGDLINASKESIKVGPGASFFASSDSFGMIRGGHVDLTFLGGMEVSAEGDVANWYAPGYTLKGMGGAMDLISGGTQVIIVMEHNTKEGKAKIVNKCSLPLTGTRCCSMIITEKAVFDFSVSGKLTLREVLQGYSLEDIKQSTDATFVLHPDLVQL